MDFDAWMKQVNRVFVVNCGLGIDELPDAPYWDAWDDGLTPQEMYDLYVEEYDDTGLMREL